MMTRQTIAIASLAILTYADAASAQVPASAQDPASASTQDPAPDPAPRYPRSVYARPLTLPSGIAMLGADFIANKDLSSVLAAPILGFGITDDLEIQVPYVFALEELEAKGSLNADVGYKLVRGWVGGKLEIIGRVRGGYNLLTETANPILIGVHVQYNLTDQIALITGTPGSQQLRISVTEDGTMAKPIDLSLPIAIGLQATPELYFQLDVKLAQFELRDSANAYIGADTTPVTATVVYNAVPALDLQAAIGTDLSNEPGEAIFFVAGARVYIGAL